MSSRDRKPSSSSDVTPQAAAQSHDASAVADAMAAASMYAGMSALYPSLMHGGGLPGSGFDPLVNPASPFYFPFGIGGSLSDPSSSLRALAPPPSLFGDSASFSAPHFSSALPPEVKKSSSVKTKTPAVASAASRSGPASDVINGGAKCSPRSKSPAVAASSSSSRGVTAAGDATSSYETFLAKAMSSLPPPAALQASLLTSASSSKHGGGGGDERTKTTSSLSSQTQSTLRPQVRFALISS